MPKTHKVRPTTLNRKPPKNKDKGQVIQMDLESQKKRKLSDSEGAGEVANRQSPTPGLEDEAGDDPVVKTAKTSKIRGKAISGKASRNEHGSGKKPKTVLVPPKKTPSDVDDDQMTESSNIAAEASGTLVTKASATETGQPSKRPRPAATGEIQTSGNVSSSAAETSSASSTPVIPDFLQQKNLQDWSTNDVFTFLNANKNRQFGDEHIKVIQDQEIAGIAFLELTDQRLIAQFNLKIGPAIGIQKLIENLKVAKGLVSDSAPQEPLPKKARLHDGLTPMEAVEKAELTNKAIVNGCFDLSLLNEKERVTVLGFMGQEVRSQRNSFMMLFRTACDLKNKKIRDIISVPQSGVGLPVINIPSLYIRESYRNLYEYIGKNFADSPPWTTNRITVTGTSGIGKSAFLVYFTIRLLAESNDDNPPIIIFHAKGGDSECYAFGGKTTFRAGSIIDFADLLTLPETWYLADSVSHPWLRTAKTIIAVSPKTLNSGANDYQEVTKTTPIKYYMEPWMLDELEVCRSKIFTVVPKDFMEELYNMIGGVPRYVLQAAATVLVRDPNNRDGAVKDACSRVNKAIDEVKKPSMLLQCVAQARESLEFSSRLLHHWPLPLDHTTYHLAWASNHILEEIHNQLDAQAWEEVLKDLVKEDKNHNLRGRLFEMYVIHIFRKGGYVFEVKNLQDNTSSRLTIPKNPPYENFRKLDLSQYDEQREGTKKNKKTKKTEKLLLPSNPNHPCVDLVLTPDNMFQVTVSSQHPIKQNPLKNIVDKIPNSDRKSRLYFIVPADVYTNFRLQNYETEDGKVAKNVPKAITDRVEQWALKFDLRTAAIGKSPGVGNGAPY